MRLNVLTALCLSIVCEKPRVNYSFCSILGATMIDSRHSLCLILSLEAVCPSIVCDHIEGSQVGLWIIGTTSSMEVEC